MEGEGEGGEGGGEVGEVVRELLLTRQMLHWLHYWDMECFKPKRGAKQNDLLGTLVPYVNNFWVSMVKIGGGRRRRRRRHEQANKTTIKETSTQANTQTNQEVDKQAMLRSEEPDQCGAKMSLK